jgi:hypothetical protein
LVRKSVNVHFEGVGRMTRAEHHRPLLIIAGARFLFAWQYARHVAHANDNAWHPVGAA